MADLADDLLPDFLERPEWFDAAWWREESPTAFVQRLLQFGGPEIRYNIAGYVHTRADLFKLDHLVFQIRRLCVELDEPIDPNRVNLTRREGLRRDHSFAELHSGSPLRKLRAQADQSSEVAKAAFNLNWRFAPANHQHEEGMQYGTKASNPVLNRRMARYLESDDERSRAIGAAVRGWFLSNNQVSGPVKREICELGPQFIEPKRGWISQIAEFLIVNLDRASGWLKDRFR